MIFSACAGLFHNRSGIGRSVSPTEPMGKVRRELSQDENIQRGMTAGNIFRACFNKTFGLSAVARACPKYANRSAEKKPSRDSPGSHRFRSVLPGNAVSIKTG